MSIAVNVAYLGERKWKRLDVPLDALPLLYVDGGRWKWIEALDDAVDVNGRSTKSFREVLRNQEGRCSSEWSPVCCGSPEITGPMDLVAMLKCSDEETVMDALRRCRGKPDNVRLVPHLVDLLDDARPKDLINHALFLLTNVAAGKTGDTRAVFEAGAVPKLLRLLQDRETVYEATCALANIAADCADDMLGVAKAIADAPPPAVCKNHDDWVAQAMAAMSKQPEAVQWMLGAFHYPNTSDTALRYALTGLHRDNPTEPLLIVQAETINLIRHASDTVCKEALRCVNAYDRGIVHGHASDVIAAIPSAMTRSADIKRIALKLLARVAQSHPHGSPESESSSNTLA